MKIRYMIDNVLRGSKAAPRYEPVGVWAHCQETGEIEMYYVENQAADVQARREEADWVINRLVEGGLQTVPDDFLDYHRRTRSPYDGTFSEIRESEAFGDLDDLGKYLLPRISEGGRQV